MDGKKERIPWNKGKKGLQISWNKGIPCSEETKKKISESKKGMIGIGKGKKNPHARERLIGKTGNKAIRWKGGKFKTTDGYICIYYPEHPYPQNGTTCYVLEHRLVMEKYIGRFLLPNEAVHHKNGIRDDNRIENLWLTTHSEHMKFHASQRIVSEETREKHRLLDKERERDERGRFK